MNFNPLLALRRSTILRPLAVVVGITAVLNAGIWFAALQYFPSDDTSLVLHYSVDVGIDFVGQGSHITVLPLTGAILLLLNLIVGLAATSADKRVSWVLWGAMPLFQIVLAAALFFIWHVNF